MRSPFHTILLKSCSLILITVLSGCATVSDRVKDDYVYYPQNRPGQNMNGVKQDLARLVGTANSPGIKYYGEKTKNNLKGEATLQELVNGKSGDIEFLYDDKEDLVYMAFSHMDVLEDRIEIAPQLSFHFADLPGSEIAVRPYWIRGRFGRTIAGKVMPDDGVRPYKIDFPRLMSFLFGSREDAENFADDLYFIQQAMQQKHDQRRARFDAKVATYREAKVKPAVSEEQRKYIVQANSLNQNKEYARAIELYEQALDIDPVSYPGAYFNLALLSAQLKRYREAVGYMQQYLQLAPEARDARSAQDKIYEWELLLQPK